MYVQVCSSSFPSACNAEINSETPVGPLTYPAIAARTFEAAIISTVSVSSFSWGNAMCVVDSPIASWFVEDSFRDRLLVMFARPMRYPTSLGPHLPNRAPSVSRLTSKISCLVRDTK